VDLDCRSGEPYILGIRAKAFPWNEADRVELRTLTEQGTESGPDDTTYVPPGTGEPMNLRNWSHRMERHPTVPGTAQLVDADRRMVSAHHRLLGLTAVLVMLLSGGCASVTPPIEREPGYPDEWPDIASLDAQCAGLAGRYANRGTVLDQNGEALPIELTDILLSGSAQVGDSVSLEAVAKKKRASDKNTPARLLVGLGDQASDVEELSDCFCIREALFCPGLHMSSVGGPGIGLVSGQQNVWLTRGVDGSLLVRIEHHTAGIVVVVPVRSQSRSWARFDPVAE
jgi:hypothetical protein